MAGRTLIIFPPNISIISIGVFNMSAITRNRRVRFMVASIGEDKHQNSKGEGAV